MSKLTNKLYRLIKKYKEIIQHNEGFCRLLVVSGAQYHISYFSIINAWKNIAELGAGTIYTKEIAGARALGVWKWL